MPQFGSNRSKGTGSIRERSAGHYELRYYDKLTKRQTGYVVPVEWLVAL